MKVRDTNFLRIRDGKNILNMKNKFLLTLAASSLMIFICCGSEKPDYSGFYVDRTEQGGNGDSQEKPDTPAVPDKPSIPDGGSKIMNLKVMSFNIRYYNYKEPLKDGNNSWDYRKVAFAPMIKEYQPTVVGMQEARPAQLEYLDAEWSGYKRLGVGRRTGSNHDEKNDEYVPIWYNTNEVELESSGSWGYFWLSDTPSTFSFYPGSGSPRIAVWAVFVHKETSQKFFFVNTHIDINGTDKTVPVKQMKVLREQMDKINRDKLPTMLTADFNKTLDATPYIFGPVEDMYNVRTALSGGDTDYSGTYNNWGGSNLIVDHIYCSKDLTPVTYKVIKTRYREVPYISDHYPIIGTLSYTIK